MMDGGSAFQFHKGTIRTLPTWHIHQPHPDFNSIKVRLEPYKLSLYEKYREFQFHKGTIRTLLLVFVIGIYITNFNSIKVRLELTKIVISTLQNDISIP